MLPPTTDPPGPGVAVFGADGVWRHRGGSLIDEIVQEEVTHIGAVLINDHYVYMRGVAKALQRGLGEDLSDVPPKRPIYDPENERSRIASGTYSIRIGDRRRDHSHTRWRSTMQQERDNATGSETDR